MRKPLLSIFICLGLLLVAGGSTPALAGHKDAVGVKEARAHVRSAKRALARARAALREARHVERETRHYSELYGSNVGRWVWLANDVGWPRSEWGQLLYVINRESRGVPEALNASGAAGLMQEMPGWYDAVWWGHAYNPFSPRANLYYGRKIWQRQGWTPWAIN